MINPTFLLIGSILCLGVGGVIIFKLSQGEKNASQTLGFNEIQDSFTQEVHLALGEAFPDENFVYDSETDTFKPATQAHDDSDDNTSPLRIFLGNLRNRAQDMGTADRKAFLQNFLKQVSQNQKITAEVLKEKLLMRCRTQEEFSTREFLMKDNSNDNNYEPIIISKGEMQFEPVLNYDETIQSLSVPNMREAEFTFDEAVQLAGQNLLSITPQASADHWEKLEDNIWISRLYDDFDSARLFLFPEHIAFPFTENPIAYAPSHAVCLITPNSDKATLTRLIALGDESSQTHRPLSRALWQQTDDQWRRLESDDRYSPIGHSRFSETLINYDDQQSAVAQFFETSEIDIHVAKIMTREINEEGQPDRLETLAVFIGQHSYLPKTDFIVLAFDELKTNDDIKDIPWDKFVEIIGAENLIAHPDLKPVRYMFNDPISVETIQALVKAAKVLS